jgi:hypothetical protein
MNDDNSFLFTRLPVDVIRFLMIDYLLMIDILHFDNAMSFRAYRSWWKSILLQIQGPRYQLQNTYQLQNLILPDKSCYNTDRIVSLSYLSNDQFVFILTNDDGYDEKFILKICHFNSFAAQPADEHIQEEESFILEDYCLHYVLKDGRLLAASSQGNHPIHLINQQEKTSQPVIEHPSCKELGFRGITSMFQLLDGRLATTDFAYLYLWDVNSWEFLLEDLGITRANHSSGSVFCLRQIYDSRLIHGTPYGLAIFDMETDELHWIMDEDDGPCQGCQQDGPRGDCLITIQLKDGRIVCGMNINKTIKVYNQQTWLLEKVLREDSSYRMTHRGISCLSQLSDGRIVVNYLNSMEFYDVENFPFCVFENQGELLIETLELMSGKKINITGAKGLTASKPGESRQDDTKRASEKGKLIASADRVLFKNQQIVNFLVNNGALLSHINVIWLLNKEDYLLMLEHEASKDKSIRFTPAMWNMKKKQWDDQWLEFSRRAWLDVLLQAIKIFVLSRVSFKDYAVMPGIVLSSKTTSQLSAVAATKGKKQNQPFIPKDLAASNIFTHGEQVLLTWVSYHLDRAEGLADEGANANSNSFLISSNSNGLNKRVVDLAACFSDFFPFCQLFHSHVSDITQKGEPLSGYTTFDRSRIEEIFARFEECLIQYHVDIPGLNSDETLKSSRNIMLLVLHLFLNLPHLIPKTKIEFSGMLGTPIFKKIELKNPSKKPLLYSVTLKGSSDYSIERDQLIIPPESAVEFLVTLNARFMHSVISKIFFWNIKDSNYSNGPTLSFQCLSQIRGIQPIEKVSKQINLFENETSSLMVKNPYHRDIVVKVKLEIRFCQKGLEEFMPSAKSKKKAQPEIFREIPLTKPALETDEFGLNINSQEENKNASADDWEIENMFRQPFWCNDETISIPKGSSKQLNVFMLPFQMGKYICQIIFVEPDLGEFSHEINAEVIYPKPSEKLSADLLQGSASKIQLSFNSKNSNFEKALSVVTEARIKNANKKIRARSVFTNFLTTKVSNEECGASVFVLDFTAQYFTYTKKFLLVSEYLKWSGKSLESGSNNVKLKKFAKSSLDILSSAESNNDSTDASLNRNFLNFSPEKAGVYKTLALIHPEDNICDLRCIELYLTAKYLMLRCSWNFAVQLVPKFCKRSQFIMNPIMIGPYLLP